MDVLQVLEQKIASLIDLVKNLKEKNSQLNKDVASMGKENQTLKTENTKLAQEHAHINTKLASLENVEKKALESNNQIDELNQEKAFTKMAVDDLLERLKSIDSLIEKQ